VLIQFKNESNKKIDNMKKVKLLIALGAVLTMVSIAYSSFAQSTESKPDSKMDNWVMLGSHVVDYTLDRDVVDLEDATDLYTGLKFKVVNGPINLHKCTIHFAGGETQDVTFSTDATSSTSTSASDNNGRQVDLYGNTRKIDKITFWYDTKNSSDKKAVVEVWGKK
jgi:hypothetical protein